MQKSYYHDILIKLVLLINLMSIQLILKCKCNVYKRAIFYDLRANENYIWNYLQPRATSRRIKCYNNSLCTHFEIAQIILSTAR